MPQMRVFSHPQATPASRSNTEIARDFLDLTFRMESGRHLKAMTRFEGPISVTVKGDPSSTLVPDLERLLLRLRNEAHLNITRTYEPDASITVMAVRRSDIQKAIPSAACFVAPNVSSIAEYRLTRRTKITDWGSLDTRRKITIFVPNDTSPQETRDCLHEELAQALGPLNDLYRLPDSIFNDDNIHTVLTGFDMLVLRTTYAPELSSGMTRTQVASKLPGILARLNPAGEKAPGPNLPYTPDEWKREMIAALGVGTPMAQRLPAAERALHIAQLYGLTDVRMGFTWFSIGRLAQRTDLDMAMRAYLNADQYFAANAGTELHRAHVASQVAALALRQDNPMLALQYIEANLPTASRAENAALLSALMLLRSEALKQAGMATDARSARVDSLAWARYGFGSERETRQRLRAMTGFSPL